MKKIILFNGPPGTGKDDGASYLEKKYGKFKIAMFKDVLFKKTVDHFQVDYDWFLNEYDNREVKERPEKFLNGLSRRQALIYVSEELIKPKFGKDFFGEKLAEEIENNNYRYLISDLGFVEEIYPLINKFGSDNICIVQIHRNNFSFKGDSRKFVNGNLKGEFISGGITNIYLADTHPNTVSVDMYRIFNNGTLEDYYLNLDKLHKEVTFT